MKLKENQNEQSSRPLNKGLFTFSIIFGISSWVVFSGIWVEAPLLLHHLPEGWKIPSMIGAVSQLAQVGPILLLLMKCKCVSCCSNSFSRCLRKGAVSDRAIVYGLLIIGMIAGTCLALFWDKTMVIFGQTRSYVFFICVFFLAILDCTCTIAFLTYIGGFRGDYVTALYIGEGISSLLPSLFALLQGTGDSSHECFNSTTNSTLTNIPWSNSTIELNLNESKNKPRFSISTYFWLLLSTLIVSFLAFLVLEFYPGFRKERISKHTSSPSHRYSIDSKADKQESPLIRKRKRSTIYKAKQANKKKNLDKFVLFTAITFISFVLYGILPALSSYSAMPYGSKIMHLSSTLALISQPISSMFATFFRIKSTSNMIKLLIFTILLSSYIIMASFMSPCPPFKHKWYSGYLMIWSWVASFFLLMYLRCCVTCKLKEEHGENSLIWCGTLTQLGQFIGSISIYLLVDFGNVFKEVDPCINYECKNFLN